MTRSTIKGAILGSAVAAVALAAQTSQASATGQLITPVAAAAPESALGVGLAMGAGASTILRAAYVWNTQCRYLTFDEAVTGLLPIWPLFQQVNNQCVTTQTISMPRRRHHRR